MTNLAEVTDYIDKNVLHSALFDLATREIKQKAVNQAAITLARYLPQVYVVPDDIPVSDIAEQALWALSLDDSVRRADHGATSISVDGISISFLEMDRTIAPNILRLYGIRSTQKRRVGSYHMPLEDTSRNGNEYPPSRGGGLH